MKREMESVNARKLERKENGEKRGYGIWILFAWQNRILWRHLGKI